MSTRSCSCPIPAPSEWVLAFDTETTTDPAQRLRFGSFQLRHAGKLVKHGLFYDRAALNRGDQRVIRSFARGNGLELLTITDFIENVFYKFGYQLRATIVGFNLPFDLARLALEWCKGENNEWSLTLSQYPDGTENLNYPRILITPIDGKKAFIKLAKPWKPEELLVTVQKFVQR